MFEIQGARYRVCDGVSRRDVLRVGAPGLAGLGLPDVLRLRAQAAETSGAPPACDKSVIFVFLVGWDLSHIDMYDLKPDCAGRKIGANSTRSRPTCRASRCAS